jgi:hypothetical protein
MTAKQTAEALHDKFRAWSIAKTALKPVCFVYERHEYMDFTSIVQNTEVKAELREADGVRVQVSAGMDAEFTSRCLLRLADEIKNAPQIIDHIASLKLPRDGRRSYTDAKRALSAALALVEQWEKCGQAEETE